jgi:hypothetical protein
LYTDELAEGTTTTTAATKPMVIPQMDLHNPLVLNNEKTFLFLKYANVVRAEVDASRIIIIDKGQMQY